MENFGIWYLFCFTEKIRFQYETSLSNRKISSMLPSLNSFLKFLEKRCVILENIESTGPKPQIKIISAHPSTSQLTQS